MGQNRDGGAAFERPEHPHHPACAPRLHSRTTAQQKNVERFQGGLVFKAHIFLYHSTLGSRGIKKEAGEGGSGRPVVLEDDDVVTLLRAGCRVKG